MNMICNAADAIDSYGNCVKPPDANRVNTSIGAQNKQQRDDCVVNLGLAVQTLREDMPLIFAEDFNYEIYRDDITFMDPLNTFTGIDSYKIIFWALRFHGRIWFRDSSVVILSY
ncbi:hypothetical protein ACLB2K_030920 [Fragaria x ananassa]